MVSSLEILAIGIAVYFNEPMAIITRKEERHFLLPHRNWELGIRN
jgi:hypothetical protein